MGAGTKILYGILLAMIIVALLYNAAIGQLTLSAMTVALVGVFGFRPRRQTVSIGLAHSPRRPGT